MKLLKNLVLLALVLMMCVGLFTGCANDTSAEDTEKAIAIIRENSTGFPMYIGMPETEVSQCLDLTTYKTIDESEAEKDENGKLKIELIGAKTIVRGTNKTVYKIDDYTYFEASPYPEASSPNLITRCVTKNRGYVVCGIHATISQLSDFAPALSDEHDFTVIRLDEAQDLLQAHYGYFYVDAWGDLDTQLIERLELYLNNNPDLS